MAVFWASIFGLTVWLVLWALGIKAFDGFMITIALVVVASAYQLAKPYMLEQLGRR